MARVVEFRNGLRIAGHPLHAMLVHFPLAFWFAVFPLELAGWAGHWAPGWEIAFWANAAALAFSLPAFVSGAIDFATIGAETASAAAMRHLYAMLAAASVFLAELLARGGAAPPAGAKAFLNLGLSLAGCLVLTGGAWLGGELVFRHRIGSREANEENGKDERA